MPRKKASPSSPIPLTQWFAHIASDYVDVFSKPDSEFIQVWSKPRSERGPDRYLLLTYRRTPTGPTNISSHFRPDGTAWKHIETNGPRRTFYYADGGREHRYEEILPRGRLLINDPRQGLRIKSIFTSAFDWEKSTPIGKPLGDRAIMKLQTEGQPWFVTFYQESDTHPSILCTVDEHLGLTWVRTVDFTDTSPPQ